jgi:hypothetical protein
VVHIIVLVAMLGALAMGALAAAVSDRASAQSLFDWDRPTYEDDRRRQREGERRSRTQRRADYCRKLEQRLVQEWRRNNDTRSELPQLRKAFREAKKKFETAKSKAERSNCYEETFFFGRSLRRTPKCVKLDRDVQRARREANTLSERIKRISRSGRGQSRQDDLIAELARYGCGEDYKRQYEARRPDFFSFFDERGTSFREPKQQRPQSDLPFSTYRTMCVRQCDGYYFPVSFSTLPSQFSADETQCAERCAAPTELFVYRNPGEDVEQMVSLSGKPYSQLKNAWLYRKKFIDGCSCDASEYSVKKIAEAQQELESADASTGSSREGEPEAAKDDEGKRAESTQTGEDGLIIREVPAPDNFDPRRR